MDENGENLGVLKKEEALKMAFDKGLDLIEISPAAKPPVARIMSFDKFRYEQSKKFKEQRHRKRSEIKQIQITVRAAKNDLEIKAKKLEEFLNEGHSIMIMMVLRGREKYNRDWANLKMQEFLKMITVEYQVIMTPRFAGRGLAMQIAKK